MINSSSSDFFSCDPARVAPLANQSLGAGFAWYRCEFLQVIGIVYVNGNPRKV